MAQTEKTYSRVEEAEEMIPRLCEAHPDVLWAVNPNIIVVLGVDNKERPKNSKKAAHIRPIKGSTKALMMINNIPARYVIELYWSDWHEWDERQKLAVIFHELLHVDCDLGKTVKHDVEDFRIMVDKFGVDWLKKGDTIPHLIDDEIKFDLSLRANVPEDGNLEVNTGDEIVEVNE